MSAALAVPARFASDPRRRAMLAKIHLAPKQLGLDEADYRAIIHRVTGHYSAGQCDMRQLDALIAEFTRMGFRASAAPVGNRRGRPKPASHPVARKARAMWISLGLLCAVRNMKEPALEDFAKRQLGCERFAWANQSESDRIIEALKNMARRHGWAHDLTGLEKQYHIHALKVQLCDAILVKLQRAGIVPTKWTLARSAWELAGLGDPDAVRFDEREYEQIAAALGKILRERGGEEAFREVAR